MSAVKEEKQFQLDGLKWLLVTVLLSGAVYGNYYYSAESLLYRVVAIIAIVGVAIFVGLQTSKGAAFSELLRGAYKESRRVVWPTPQERNQTTLMVVVVVLLMSLILWGLDSLFGWATSAIIG